ncbi:MAG: hypothetical protein M3R55_09220 [Acidobacteriota bacterium]|nr:hypothetical protein [Acidobacteriota bacterium]
MATIPKHLRDGEDRSPGIAVLAELRPALLDLHKALLDWERSGYERAHGRQSSGELLRLLLGHEQFHWLHTLSQLVVRIDQEMEQDPPATAAEMKTLVETIRSTVAMRDMVSAFGQRYQAALQDSPDAVMAHQRVSSIFRHRLTIP